MEKSINIVIWLIYCLCFNKWILPIFCVTLPTFLCFALCWQLKDFFQFFFSKCQFNKAFHPSLFQPFFFFLLTSSLFLFFLVAGLLISSLKCRFIGEEEDCCFTVFFSVTWNRSSGFRGTSTWKRDCININTTERECIVGNDCLYQKKRWFKNWLFFYRK